MVSCVHVLHMYSVISPQFYRFPTPSKNDPRGKDKNGSTQDSVRLTSIYECNGTSTTYFQETIYGLSSPRDRQGDCQSTRRHGAGILIQAYPCDKEYTEPSS